MAPEAKLLLSLHGQTAKRVTCLGLVEGPTEAVTGIRYGPRSQNGLARVVPGAWEAAETLPATVLI